MFNPEQVNGFILSQKSESQFAQEWYTQEREKKYLDMKKPGIYFPEDHYFERFPILEEAYTNRYSLERKYNDEELLKVLYEQKPEEASYFGGFPLFFEGEEWPIHPTSGNPLTFLGQICISDCTEAYLGTCRALRIFIDLQNKTGDYPNYTIALPILVSDTRKIKEKCSFEEFVNTQNRNGSKHPIIIPRFTYPIQHVDFIELRETCDIYEHYVGSDPFIQSINDDETHKAIRDRAYEKADRIEKLFYSLLTAKFPKIQDSWNNLHIAGIPRFLQNDVLEHENSNGVTLPYFIMMTDLVGNIENLPGIIFEQFFIYFDPKQPTEPIAYFAENT